MTNHTNRNPEKNLSEPSDFSTEKIRDKDNIFTQIGMLCAIKEDINKIEHEVKLLKYIIKKIDGRIQNESQ